MRKRTVVCLVLPVLAILLATPLSAQSIRLQAYVPFEFSVGSATLPAGVYSVDALEGALIVRQVKPDAIDGVIVGAIRSYRLPTGKAVGTLIFHRYGNLYFLSGVNNGLTASGYQLVKPKAEKALLEGAALRGPEEEVMVLARR
jgi:hypothetical protein